MNLYELTEQYLDVLELAQEGGEGVDYAELLERGEGAISDKLDGYCKVIKTLEAQAEAIKAEATRLSQRKTTLENQVKRMKEAMKTNMLRVGIDKHKSTLFTVSVTKPRKRVEVTDIDILPSYFVKVQREADKTALMELLKTGEELPGATLVEGESGLTIR